MLSCLPHVPKELADSWYGKLSELEYEHHEVSLYGKKVLEPRVRLHFGAEGTNYTYSGTNNVGSGFPPLIDEIRLHLQEMMKEELARPTGIEFNFVLVNCYRNIQDSISWHSDDERSILPGQPILSLSLGVTRKFQVRPRKGVQADVTELTVPKGYRGTVSKTGVLTLPLDHGAVIVMNPGFQSTFQHQVPKQAKSMQTFYQESPVRFNLTFRVVTSD